MNGIEAASRIIELCNSRVIYVTGNRQFQHDPNVLHTDPVAFLIKPVRERRLLELIRSAESS
jgi:DNA-binding LytR/AlgR family response regulator